MSCHWQSAIRPRPEARQAGSRKPIRASSSAAVRSKAGYPVRPSLAGGRVGQAPVDQPRPAGELGAGLAGLVAQADHVVEPLSGGRRHRRRAGGRRCRRRTGPASPPPRRGCTGLGRIPALAASTRAPARCRSSPSAIGERLLLPVHTNSTRRGRPARHARSASPGRRAARGTGPAGGCSAEAARRRPPAPPRSRPGPGCSRCRARRSCCAARTPGRPVRSWRRW